MMAVGRDGSGRMLAIPRRVCPSLLYVYGSNLVRPRVNQVPRQFCARCLIGISRSVAQSDTQLHRAGSLPCDSPLLWCSSAEVSSLDPGLVAEGVSDQATLWPGLYHGLPRGRFHHHNLGDKISPASEFSMGCTTRPPATNEGE